MSRNPNPIGEALDEIERSILPGLSRLLDGLLDSAALARPGVDADAYADGLRQTAQQVSGLTQLVAAVAPLADSGAVSRRMSA